MTGVSNIQADFQAMPTKTKPTQIHKTPKPSPTVGELTSIQEQLADIVGDIILHGGHSEEVDPLLYAAVAHSWKMRFSNNSDYPKLNDDAQEWAQKHWENWKQRLIRSWPDPHDHKEGKRAVSNTVTEF